VKRLTLLLVIVGCHRGKTVQATAESVGSRRFTDGDSAKTAISCQEVQDPNHIFSPIAVMMSKLNCLHEAATSAAEFDSLAQAYCVTKQDPTRCKDIAKQTTYYPAKAWAAQP
jgi:hypothetical protein